MYYYVHATKRNFILFTIILLCIPFLGFGYLYAAEHFPIFFWPCGLKQHFHLYCPGCGGTHAMEALLHFDFAASIQYNPLVLYMVVCVLYYYIKTLVLLIKNHGTAEYSMHLGYLWGFVALMVLVFVVRNLLVVYCHIDYLGELAQYW